MKAFIIKNKFFVSLLAVALLIIASLSIYTLQKRADHEVPSDVDHEDPIVDLDKQAEITAMSISYTRSNMGISGNVITVSWAYSENASKVDKVYLYLNDDTPINVTSNSYYDFTQGVYDYPTGENKVKLELRLEDGKTIVKEKTIYVQTIISTKQEVLAEGSTMKVTLEYMCSSSNPAEVPEILITNSDSENSPVVAYVDTQSNTSGNKVTARTTYALSWNTTNGMAKKLSIRWKFNAIQDSFDYTVVNPLKNEEK